MTKGEASGAANDARIETAPPHDGVHQTDESQRAAARASLVRALDKARIQLKAAEAALADFDKET